MKPKGGARWVEWANEPCTAKLRHEVREELQVAYESWEGLSRCSSDPSVQRAVARWLCLKEFEAALSPKAEEDDDNR